MEWCLHVVNMARIAWTQIWEHWKIWFADTCWRKWRLHSPFSIACLSYFFVCFKTSFFPRLSIAHLHFRFSMVLLRFVGSPSATWRRPAERRNISRGEYNIVRYWLGFQLLERAAPLRTYRKGCRQKTVVHDRQFTDQNFGPVVSGDPDELQELLNSFPLMKEHLYKTIRPRDEWVPYSDEMWN